MAVPRNRTYSDYACARTLLILSSSPSKCTVPRAGTCPVCKTYRERLDRHILIHLNIKPYACSFCSKAFRQDIQLGRHISLHHSENPPKFECDTCGKTLSRKDKLRDHIRNVHTK